MYISIVPLTGILLTGIHLPFASNSAVDPLSAALGPLTSVHPRPFPSASFARREHLLYE